MKTPTAYEQQHPPHGSYLLTTADNPKRALIQNASQNTMTHPMAMPAINSDVTQQRHGRQMSIKAAKCQNSLDSSDQTYMNAGEAKADSLYSDSVKYYVLENVQGQPNFSPI